MKPILRAQVLATLQVTEATHLVALGTALALGVTLKELVDRVCGHAEACGAVLGVEEEG